MDLVLMSLPTVPESYPLTLEVSQIYASQMIWNNWSSICLNYDSDIENGQLQRMHHILTAIALVPILMCSDCGPCRKVITFGIEWNVFRLSLRLNVSYAVELYRDPFCGRTCDGLKRRVHNAEEDSIRIYLPIIAEGEFITWQNSKYVTGPKAGFLRLFVDSVKNDVEFVGPSQNWNEKPVPQEFIKAVAPFKFDYVSIGNES